MWVKAYFEESGAPKTGLSPTVTIYDMLREIMEFGKYVEKA